MHPFIKENLSLVVALALPVVFAVFFLISKQITFREAPPPAYDFILAQNIRHNGYFDIVVVDNAFSLKFTYPNAEKDVPNIQTPEIYYVNARTMIAEPLGVELPADARNPSPGKERTSVRIPVAKLENLRLSAARISPDGYELDTQYHYRGGNLMTEIFDSRSRRYEGGVSLRKDNTRQSIKGLGNNHSLEIVGWVIPEGDAPQAITNTTGE